MINNDQFTEVLKEIFNEGHEHKGQVAIALAIMQLTEALNALVVGLAEGEVGTLNVTVDTTEAPLDVKVSGAIFTIPD
jgi:hypothetical protein